MRNFKRCAPVFLAAFVGLSCTESAVRVAGDSRPATQGVIVGFEGLQPFSGNSVDSLTKQVAADANLAQSSSSGSYLGQLPMIRRAHAAGQPVYIVGYSLGGVEATNLAWELRREKIPVDVLFLLDPGALCSFNQKVPSNVRRVVFYQSGSCDALLNRPLERFLEDPSSTRVEFEDLSSESHLSLPQGLAWSIESRILPVGR